MRDTLARLISAAPTPKYQDKVEFAKAQAVAEHLMRSSSVIEFNALWNFSLEEPEKTKRARKEPVES